MAKQVVCLSQGVADPAAKRALRALEQAINEALATISDLRADVEVLEDGGAGVPSTRAINTTAPLSGGGDLSADRTISIAPYAGGAPGAVPTGAGSTTKYLREDGTWAVPPDTNTGEANTASNAGSGAGVYKTKSGVDLVLRSLVSGSSDLTIAQGTNEITFTVGAIEAGGLFGDGSDGDVTLGAGSTTLTRDMFYDNLEIPSGSHLNTAGFRVFVRGTLTLAGTIGRFGNNGAVGSGGSAAAGGAALSGGCLPVSGSGGSGGAGSSLGVTGGGTMNQCPRGFSAAAAPGGTHPGGGAAGNPGTAGGAGHGGGGGAGSNNAGSAGFAGGAGTTLTLAAATMGDVRAYGQIVQGRGINNTAFTCASGGGGGGGGQTGGGGGGGGGGAWVVVSARLVDDQGGSVVATGGNGGNATGNGGGGGGGGGGVIGFVLGSGSFPTLNVSGGTGGTGGGTAPGGGAGGAGGAGITIQYRVNN